MKKINDVLELVEDIKNAGFNNPHVMPYFDKGFNRIRIEDKFKDEVLGFVEFTKRGDKLILTDNNMPYLDVLKEVMSTYDFNEEFFKKYNFKSLNDPKNHNNNPFKKDSIEDKEQKEDMLKNIIEEKEKYEMEKEEKIEKVEDYDYSDFEYSEKELEVIEKEKESFLNISNYVADKKEESVFIDELAKFDIDELLQEQIKEENLNIEEFGINSGWTEEQIKIKQMTNTNAILKMNGVDVEIFSDSNNKINAIRKGIENDMKFLKGEAFKKSKEIIDNFDAVDKNIVLKEIYENLKLGSIVRDYKDFKEQFSEYIESNILNKMHKLSIKDNLRGKEDFVVKQIAENQEKFEKIVAKEKTGSKIFSINEKALNKNINDIQSRFNVDKDTAKDLLNKAVNTMPFIRYVGS